MRSERLLRKILFVPFSLRWRLVSILAQGGLVAAAADSAGRRHQARLNWDPLKLQIKAKAPNLLRRRSLSPYHYSLCQAC